MPHEVLHSSILHTQRLLSTWLQARCAEVTQDTKKHFLFVMYKWIGNYVIFSYQTKIIYCINHGWKLCFLICECKLYTMLCDPEFQNVKDYSAMQNTCISDYTVWQMFWYICFNKRRNRCDCTLQLKKDSDNKKQHFSLSTADEFTNPMLRSQRLITASMHFGGCELGPPIAAVGSQEDGAAFACAAQLTNHEDAIVKTTTLSYILKDSKCQKHKTNWCMDLKIKPA